MNAFERMTLIVKLAIRARRAKMSPGSTGIVGLTGIAHTAIAPEGTVFVRGELWPASSPMNVSQGENVRVTGAEGLMLDVEAEKDEAIVPRTTSAIDD